MARLSLSRLTFARQMLVVQLGVVVAVIALTTVTYGVLSTVSTREDAQQTALGIARSTAADAELISAVAAESTDPVPDDAIELARGPVQSIAEAVRVRTSALFVVVTDDRGLRLAHPNPALLGQQVSTDPTAALAGLESTSWESGTLGDSARAKVPVRTASGDVVGEVSVGIPASRVFEASVADIIGIAGVAAAALAIGVVASSLLSRRLRRQTLGLQPRELAGMVLDQSAVIGGIGEGVLGVTPGGVVSVCNGRASDLLGLTGAVGLRFSDLGLPAELLEVVDAPRHDPARSALRLVIGGRLLYVDVSRVTRDERPLGTVVVLRDETDLASLSHRLEAVEAASRALRVQRHEFANRLHVVSGLVATGQTGEAQSYLAGILEHGPVNFPVENAGALTEPYLQAFAGAKAIEAAERGVVVRIGPESSVSSNLSRPEEVTAVLGNLIDNAVTAAALGSREPRWVQLDALDDGRDLHLAVSDSGDGVSGEAEAGLFRPRTGRGAGLGAGGDDPVHGLGVGLILSRDIVRRDGGDLWLASASSADGGAVFCARLVGVLTGVQEGSRS